MTLDSKIEALLFFRAEPISTKEIGKLLSENESTIKKAIQTLEEKLEDGGIQVIWKDSKVMLGTHPDMGPILEKLRKEELNKDLTKAAQETLSIILYKGGVTRSEIDWIRGVNSSFILRSLLVRGLVERKTDPRDSRKYFYQATFDLLQYLGISKIEELPEYEEISKKFTEGVETKSPESIAQSDEDDNENNENNGGDVSDVEKEESK